MFASPRSAVDAAVAAQRELALPVRMGIATGEAELRGSDYFGSVLNRAARVMAAGHGGQILIDGPTAALLSGVDLIDLGSRRLRDLTQPVELFQVHAPDLRTDFPALATLDPTPGNLRSASTSLVGRERELFDVCAEVQANRLVTLTGVGGVGRCVSNLRLGNNCLSIGVLDNMRHGGGKTSAEPTSGTRIGYTRVSTVAQTLDQQNEALAAAGVAKT